MMFVRRKLLSASILLLASLALLFLINVMNTQSEIKVISKPHQRKTTGFNISYLTSRVLEDEKGPPIVAGDMDIREFLKGIEKEDDQWSRKRFSLDQIEGKQHFYNTNSANCCKCWQVTPFSGNSAKSSQEKLSLVASRRGFH